VKASSAFKSIKNTLAEREEAEHQRNNPAQILLRLARRVLELVARLLSWLSDTWRRVWWALANAMVSDRMTKLERTLGWTYGGEVQAAAQEARWLSTYCKYSFYNTIHAGALERGFFSATETDTRLRGVCFKLLKLHLITPSNLLNSRKS
jgi:hypothetical protein